MIAPPQGIQLQGFAAMHRGLLRSTNQRPAEKVQPPGGLSATRTKTSEQEGQVGFGGVQQVAVAGLNGTR